MRQVDFEHRLEEVADQPLHQRHDLVLREERGLDVELREIGLTIGPQVFITEAACDLVVALEARHHQQLLEDLRRLGQREELAGVRARRYEVVAGAFWRRLRQHRCFDVDETRVVEVAAQCTGRRVAHPQALRHHVAPQVDIAVAQPHFFGDLLVELERQRLRAVQDLELAREDFDAARGEIRIDSAGRALAHEPRHAHHELVAQFLRALEHRLRVRIEDHLHEARAVAQVGENHAAVIPPPVHPARYRDCLACRSFVDLPAKVCTHPLSLRRINLTLARARARTRPSHAGAGSA